MSSAQLKRFRDKIRQLNEFIAEADRDPALHQRLFDCSSHDEVVAIAREYGYVINRRWGDAFAPGDVGYGDNAADTGDRG